MKYTVVSTMIIAGVFLSSCSSTPPREITVSMKEFAFEPDSVSLQAGEKVKLTLVNEGALNHEMLIGRNADLGYKVYLLDPDHDKVTIGGGDEHAASHDAKMADTGLHIQVKPGKKAVLTFTAPPNKAGEWEMGCFLDNGVHYEEGLHIPVHIEQGAN